MYILGVESSAVSASAALMKDGKIIGEAYINAGLTHSQTLMTLIDNVLNNADISFKDVDIAAVAHGPGSFTGIRIGVAAVKGLCFVNNTPCYGISTLEGLANCADVDSFIICPVMDARCMQVYTALFEKQNGEIVIDGLSLNTESKTVKVDGEPVRLTPVEYKILELLVRNRGRVFSAEDIYSNVWNEQNIVGDNTIAVHVRHIREKIEINPKEPKYLKVVWGIGYKID